MREMRLASAALAVSVVAGCHAAAPPRASESAAESTVFTDSLKHAQLCQPVRPGEDWRRVCTPLDQGVRPVRPLPSVPPSTPP